MALYTLARFAVRPDARAEVERAMHELAAYVRRELPGSSWTVYRDPDAPTHFTAMLRADDAAAEARHHAAAGVQAFEAVLARCADAIELRRCELVTSSDLAPRHRPARARRRPR